MIPQLLNDSKLENNTGSSCGGETEAIPAFLSDFSKSIDELQAAYTAAVKRANGCRCDRERETETYEEAHYVRYSQLLVEQDERIANWIEGMFA